MNIERIKEIQQNTTYPESISVYQALLQVWNECAQEQNLQTVETQALNIPDVICSLILAKIEHINDLGKSTWYEVVYYDDKWYSYSGSKTFEDGEQVVKWKYANDCI